MTDAMSRTEGQTMTSFLPLSGWFPYSKLMKREIELKDFVELLEIAEVLP